MMHTTRTMIGLALVGGILIGTRSGPLHAAATFTPLGDLPGGSYYSAATYVSADGSVVVGESNSTSGFEAFRWTSGSGIVGLGDLPGGPFQSESIDVSGDGSVVVGIGNSASGAEAFRWTVEGGMVGLGDLPGGIFDSQALGVSADGSVVVGIGTAALGLEAFRWTASGGMVGLGDLPGGPFTSGAFGISDDGAVVVGSGNAVLTDTAVVTAEAFRWTADGGMVGLGDLPGGIFLSLPEGVSADGSVVVGYGNGDFGTEGAEAFRWTSGDGMVGLGDLPGGGFSSAALDVSADGSVVVGSGITERGREAFVWTAHDGMQNLRDLLSKDGAEGLTGWTLRQARGVSADGRTIVGFGINPRGQVEAWTATIPEPSSNLLLTVAIAASLSNLRRRATPTCGHP